MGERVHVLVVVCVYVKLSLQRKVCLRAHARAHHVKLAHTHRCTDSDAHTHMHAHWHTRTSIYKHALWRFIHQVLMMYRRCINRSLLMHTLRLCLLCKLEHTHSWFTGTIWKRVVPNLPLQNILIAEAMNDIRLYESWVIHMNFNMCDRYFRFCGRWGPWRFSASEI